MRAHVLALLVIAAAACSSSNHASDSGSSNGGPVRVVRGEGVACTGEGTFVCAMDANGEVTGDVLVCTSGTYAKAFSCPAGQPCGTLAGHGGVACGDVALVSAGTPCATESAGACTTDLSAVAICTGGTWTAAHHCTPEKCNVVTGSDGVGRAQCGSDDAYSVGDLCSFGEGHGICSTDHASILACVNGRAAVMTTCPSGTTCSFVQVDAGVAVECQ